MASPGITQVRRVSAEGWGLIGEAVVPSPQVLPSTIEDLALPSHGTLQQMQGVLLSSPPFPSGYKETQMPALAPRRPTLPDNQVQLVSVLGVERLESLA